MTTDQFTEKRNAYLKAASNDLVTPNDVDVIIKLCVREYNILEISRHKADKVTFMWGLSWYDTERYFEEYCKPICVPEEEKHVFKHLSHVFREVYNDILNNFYFQNVVSKLIRTRTWTLVNAIPRDLDNRQKHVSWVMDHYKLIIHVDTENYLTHYMISIAEMKFIPMLHEHRLKLKTIYDCTRLPRDVVYKVIGLFFCSC